MYALHYAASKCNETAVIQLLTDKNIDLEVCGLIFIRCSFDKGYDNNFSRLVLLKWHDEYNIDEVKVPRASVTLLFFSKMNKR